MSRLTPYEFKDTGEVVQIRKVSPLLLMQLQNRYPEPKPPMQTVDYGDGPKLEPNPASPEYAAALRQHQVDMERRIRKLLIQRGVVIEWNDERKAALADLRAYWSAENGEELEGSDEVVYVSYIAMGSDADFEELIAAILQRSQPTEAKVSETLERLKS